MNPRFALRALVLLLNLAATPLALAGDWSFLAPVNVDLYEAQERQTARANPAQVEQMNRVTIEKLLAAPPSQFARRAPFVTESEANQIFRAVFMHPVANYGMLPKYDGDRGVGFCFGRAMTAHLEAIYRGLAKDSIVKMWAVGDMKSSHGHWQFHVTTLIRGEPVNGRPVWWAIDPSQGGPVTVQQWYKTWKATDQDGKLRFFISKAEKFSPSVGQYANGEMVDPFYTNYFQDLLADFRKNGSRSAKMNGPLKHMPANGPKMPETNPGLWLETFAKWAGSLISGWTDLW